MNASNGPTSPAQRRAAALLTCEAAMVVALSIALGSFRLLELPNGGSISLAAAPVIAFAGVRGWRTGLFVGWIAGMGHALVGGTLVHPVQVLLDYGLAYAALGLAGFGAGRRGRLGAFLAALCAFLVHLACATTSGVVFFGDTLGDNAWMVSLVYNASTVVPEAVLVMLALPTVERAYARAARGATPSGRPARSAAARQIRRTTGAAQPAMRAVLAAAGEAVPVAQRPAAPGLASRAAPFARTIFTPRVS